MDKDKFEKLGFLCGSIEPEKDGVGDYCRKLGDQLSIDGCKIYYIAWNDPFVDSIFEDPQHLRFPRSASEKVKLEHLEKFITDRSIHMLSFQWVGYAHDARGLPLKLIRSLKKISKLVSLRHLMVHEIWIGVEPDCPFKQKVLGSIQRHVFKGILAAWAPTTIHTQAPFYQKFLLKLTSGVKLLPLFGNISITREITRNTSHPENVITVILFGSIPPDVDYCPFFKQLNLAAEKSGKSITIKCIGRNGSGFYLFQGAASAFASIQIVQLGTLSEEMISKHLIEADLGIGTSRPHLLCKSGTAAAFDEHGLPILCARSGSIPEILRNPPYFRVPLYELHAINEKILTTDRRIEPRSKIGEIAQMFESALVKP